VGAFVVLSVLGTTSDLVMAVLHHSYEANLRGSRNRSAAIFAVFLNRTAYAQS
jgi:hypothetical protein